MNSFTGGGTPLTSTSIATAFDESELVQGKRRPNMGILDGIFGKKERPRPDFSNVRSGQSSTAPTPGGTTPSPSAPAPTAPTTRTYVVVKGDSLSKIAKREYGDANKWRKIYEANRSIIKNPDLIYPGQELRIPDEG
jgi:nucleoid-associated protein YgaU